MRGRIPGVVVFCGVLCCAAALVAEVPSLITVQGFLANPEGAAVPNAEYNAVFSIYDVASGGSPLWTETRTIGTVDGVFSIIVGSGTPIPGDLFANSNLFLGIRVEGDPELAPRQRLVTAPYAFRALNADTADYALAGAGGGSVWVDDGSVVRLANQNDSVGIGVASPSYKLEVDGQIVSGSGCAATGVNSVVGGGQDNHVWGNRSVIGGGHQNTASANLVTIAGGYNNLADFENATVGGGQNNLAHAPQCVVAGGEYNVAAGWRSTISGGYGDTTWSDYTTIAGGNKNNADGDYSTISGGGVNKTLDLYATIGGGYSNIASGEESTVSGGQKNIASGAQSSIGGGEFNTASGWRSTVAGGYTDTASGDFSTVGGGDHNSAGGDQSTIGGGSLNYASGTEGTIAGGLGNIASGESSTVGGGVVNQANGYISTVPGGLRCIADGNYSFAAGVHAVASHEGAFVWSDASDFMSDFYSAADNEFAAQATGGVRFVTGTGPTTGVQVAAGGGSWSSMSDRNAKENFEEVDLDRLLEKLNTLPITTWNYKTQPESIRHIGPVAQEFYASFGVGEDDTHITAIDADGVALAAIKALCLRQQKIETQAVEIKRLNEAVTSLQKLVQELIKKQSGN
ncbi:MAG: tail fiber domain-containing protein [bacterium]